MLDNKKVMVTGGKSMIGSSIVKSLLMHNAIIDAVPHNECDLLIIDNIHKRIKEFKPDYVIHAAGWNGGIKWNEKYPATIYYRTALMALNVYTSAQQHNVSKVVGLLASCSYPDSKTPAYNEESLWYGLPNQTVECHGLAKRIIADYGRQISKQYDTKCISCILNNCYGPNDSYHPEKTKVVGAMIKRFVDAVDTNKPEITCWGTGSPLRDFVFSDDAGRAVVECLLKYNDTKIPINITSGKEVSIKDLTYIIMELTGYKGNVIWDTTKPDGQMRKNISNDKFKSISNMKFTPLHEGLKHTIQWYRDNKDKI